MTPKSHILCFVGAFAVASCTAGDSAESVPVLVSTEWLAANLDDPSLVLLHVASGRDGPPGELIGGARFLDYGAITQDRDSLIVEMPPIDSLAAAFRAAGVSNASRVVVYGSPGHIAARAYVTLDYLGMGDRTSVLDGDLSVWRAEGRAVADAPAQGTPGDFTPDVQDDVVVTAEWVAARLDDSAVALIDARPVEEYVGDRLGRAPRGGHIPGAYNLYWPELQVSEDHPVLKPIEEVQARYDEAGASKDGIVVSYCYIGMRASYTYVISKHLGYDTRFYDGSWNDWSLRKELPAVMGSSRR